MLSLFIFILKYEKENNKKTIFDIYLSNSRYINNWDLVDLSSPNIVGSYIYNNNLDKRILYDMIKTHDLWNTRIAILATFYFIKNEDYKDIIKMSEILIDDKRDLIHKALGWMLREVGKRDKTTLVKFLEKYSKKMPRTMLRYSIEKLSDEQKTIFMQK